MIFANAGLPMIFIELPYLTLALLPVTVVEALVYRAGLPLSLSQALRGSLVANLWSTFLGVPAAWFVLVVVEISVGGGSMWGLDTPLLRLAAVTVQAPWLIPYEQEFYWMVPAASLFLLLPFFLVSAVAERYALLKRWTNVDRRRLTCAVWLANFLSYGLLAVYWAAVLVLAHSRSVG
jgi:hypothetical protein